MVKEVRGIQKYCGEVAPALLITPHKKYSLRFPRLEPIIEEGSDNIQGLQIMPKRMLFLVPALISFEVLGVHIKKPKVRGEEEMDYEKIL
ncbi:hypothetical protein D0Y65_020109 [Glycine soja]|uniref:Uncharacterized protein n=1 Tax=Glycine soja TaxID=3848 RepID=A0A445JCA0_GLYSO|nr:hypothetical protein JHK87_020839 [Glycine soja]RZB96124.1 hypothetical protein D0Y65_020109 [Glycine soja]